MWKLLLPKSTAARTSGTGRGAGRALGLVSGGRAVTAAGAGLGAGCRGVGRGKRQPRAWGQVQAAAKDEPQPQVVVACGLRITNCAPSRPSRESISAPVRYCTLTGSTSSFTPRFSTQVSPSWICSSNSKPYCSPEQPPPCTNTRSMSFGFPSPRIRSPTLRAAASVNRSRGASCSASVVLIDLLLWAQSRSPLRRGQSRTSHPQVPSALLALPRGLRRKTHQLSLDLGAQGHFNDAVVNVALDAGGRPQNHAFAGVDIALDRPLQPHVRHVHRPFDGAGSADRQGRIRGPAGANPTGDMAVQVQPALEFDIAVHARSLADQRIDARGPGIAVEHDGSDSAWNLRLRERPRRSTGTSARAAPRHGGPSSPGR